MNENLRKRIPKTFRLRSLQNDLSPQGLKKLRVKNYSLSKFSKKKPESFFNLDKKSTKSLFPDKSSLKYLTKLQLSSIEDFRGPKILKTLKNLKSFKCNPSNESEPAYVIPYLKALPKNLITLNLNLQQKFIEVEWPSIIKIFKKISPLRNLTSFSPFYQLGEESEEYVAKEFCCINQILPRLPKLKDFSLRQEFYGQTGFQKIMKGIKIYKPVTELALTISEELLPETEKLEDYFVQEKSVHEEKPQGFNIEEEESDLSIDEEIDTEFDMLNLNNVENAPGPSITGIERKATRMMTEEISPFFNFGIFPNLKSLIWNSDCSHTLGEFVIEGYRKLTNLKDFKLKLEVRPQGTIYFFKAFFELPLLNSFALEIPYVTPEEWKLLEEFLAKQENLTSFELNLSQGRSTQDGYFAQNLYLEKFISSLNNNLNLKSLKLNCKFASLESISNGLKNLTTGCTQLKTLRIEAFDDISQCPNREFKSITWTAGLYEFLARNRRTLKSLELNIPYIMDPELLDQMLKEISNLKQLSLLSLQINNDRLNGLKNFIKYLHGTLNMKNSDLVDLFKKYKGELRPNLVVFFRSLSNLESVNLSIGGLERVKEEKEHKWFGDIFKNLKDLKRLKVFCFSMPFDKMNPRSIEEIGGNLERLKKNVMFSVDQTSREGQEGLVSQVEEIIKNVNHRNQTLEPVF